MDYHINIFNLLIGFGTLQGFIFGVLLCWKSKFKGTQTYLGLTVLFLAFYLFWVLKYDFGFQKQLPELQFLPVLFLWGIGPAFYAYLRSLSGNPVPVISVKWMFVPLLLEQLYFNSCTFIHWLNDWNTHNLNTFERIWTQNIFNVEHIVGLILIAIYLLKSYWLLKNAKVLYASNKIRSIMLCFVLLWIIWVPYTIMDIVYYNFSFPPSGFYMFYILFAILTYGIGFLGFKINDNTFTNVALLKPKTDRMVEQVVTPLMKALSEQIQLKMKQEKSYLNPDLNLSNFAKQVNLHPNKVSAIVNTVLGYSFRDFVNFYRIKAFKAQATTYDLQSKTLLSLAFDSGFNSKSSFNRAFKKFNDCTPQEYLENLNKNKAQNVK